MEKNATFDSSVLNKDKFNISMGFLPVCDSEYHFMIMAAGTADREENGKIVSSRPRMIVRYTTDDPTQDDAQWNDALVPIGATVSYLKLDKTGVIKEVDEPIASKPVHHGYLRYVIDSLTRRPQVIKVNDREIEITQWTKD